jgi:hypothetical protein
MVRAADQERTEDPLEKRRALHRVARRVGVPAHGLLVDDARRREPAPVEEYQHQPHARGARRLEDRVHVGEHRAVERLGSAVVREAHSGPPVGEEEEARGLHAVAAEALEHLPEQGRVLAVGVQPAFGPPRRRSDVDTEVHPGHVRAEQEAVGPERWTLVAQRG